MLSFFLIQAGGAGAWADMKVWNRWEAGRPREVWSHAGIGTEPSAPDPGAGNNG